MKVLTAIVDVDGRADGIVVGEVVYAPNDTGDEFVGLGSGGTTTAAVVAEVDITPTQLKAMLRGRRLPRATRKDYLSLVTSMPPEWPVGTVVHRWADGDEIGPPYPPYPPYLPPCLP